MLHDDEIDEINRLRRQDYEEGRSQIYRPYMPIFTTVSEDCME